MRLASNPGSIGAALHKTMFLRGGCPVHDPEKCAEPGRLYWDGHWPSDQYPLQDPDGNRFSVAFIPGRLSDHNLLDDKYVYRLRMMSGSLSAAMEQGCWCELQGAYFANWNVRKMTIPYAEVGEQWWDVHFISLDYGFGKSSASAHLHVRTQDGKLKTIGEFVAPHLPAYEFASEVVNRFVLPTVQGQRRRIVAVYLDPSNFKNIGDGHTIADQINEILAPYDLGGWKASNDRLGGWQLMYQMLQTGEWKIADTCPKLIEAIPSRLHDEKKPGDVLKVPGDPLDDVANDARYGIYTFLTSTEKPHELVAREAIASLAQAARDETPSLLLETLCSGQDAQFEGWRQQAGRGAGHARSHTGQGRTDGHLSALTRSHFSRARCVMVCRLLPPLFLFFASAFAADPGNQGSLVTVTNREIQPRWFSDGKWLCGRLPLPHRWRRGLRSDFQACEELSAGQLGTRESIGGFYSGVSE